MKNLCIFFLCISLFSFCTSNRKEASDCPYYKLITSDFGTSSYYVFGDLTGPDSSFTVVVTNHELYRWLFFNNSRVKEISAKEGLHFIKEEDYSNYLIDHWKKNEPIPIDSSGQKVLRYTSIKKDTVLEKLLTLNKDQILSRYFDKNILKSEATGFDLEKKIIFCLIKLGVPCRRDDMSGYAIVQDTVISTACR